MTRQNMLSMFFSAVLLFSLMTQSNAQEQMGGITGAEKRSAVYLSPMSPLFKIYAVQYDYKLAPKDEIILGLSYLKTDYDCGNTNSSSLIVGYRRYLWKNLHIEYQLWPMYDNFYEKYEKKFYKSFDIWNEFRLGYVFDFNVGKLPCFVNVQWPFGFGLFGSNKSQSFKDEVKNEKYFYFPPMFFVGIRF